MAVVDGCSPRRRARIVQVEVGQDRRGLHGWENTDRRRRGFASRARII